MGGSISNKGLFGSATVTNFTQPSARTPVLGANSFSGSIGTGSNSFDSDAFGSALKSTQQLPIDWSKFEKHTFFDSAESKVNVAFDTIINFFPFDGSNEDVAKYLDNLTGYEKYIFETLWPKYKGYLHFSGTKKGEDPAHGYDAQLGSHISVVDQAGFLYPSISKRSDQSPVIDFSSSPFTCAFHIKIPKEGNHTAPIVQKLSKRHGFSIFLSASTVPDTANVVFMLSSGTMAISASAPFPKTDSKFHHCTTVLSRQANQKPKLLIYKDGSLVSSSSQTADIGILDFLSANLTIGTGSNHYLGTYSKDFCPTTTLSASLDDFRIYGSEKNQQQIKNILSGTAGHDKTLLAYYKFNEPTGSYTNNSLVLDHSGNSLHAKIKNYTISLRANDISSPVINEDIKLSPVLFPSQENLVSLNRRLMSLAGEYDANNPNLITRMVPKHYLEEEADIMGYPTARAGVGDTYSYSIDAPGGGSIGQPQLIASLLFMWAKFFDEIKLFIDHFGNLLNIDYDEANTIADQMLPFFAKYYGISLPNMFTDAAAEQYLRGQNITLNAKTSDISLAKIQATIWRRILINFQDVIRSKGTIHGIKAIMRASGINPDTMFRFREFGGPVSLSTAKSRSFRSEVADFIILKSGSEIHSKFLSGSRIEVGKPLPVGTFVNKTALQPHGMSNYKWDGLFTSGSWTVEFFVQAQTPNLITSMSLGRIASTGSLGEIGFANCVGVGTSNRTNKTGSLSVFHRPAGGAAKHLELLLTGTNVFTNDLWHVSYGREMLNNYTSSYFLRAARQSNGTLVDYKSTHKTASFSDSAGSGDYYSSGSSQINASGSFMQFGTTGSISAATAGLNATSSPSHSKVSLFSGSIGQIRFWTKALTDVETKEHARNFKSLGVENPLLNFNFVTEESGSFERMRIDAACDQSVTQSDSGGGIEIFDYSQNNLHMTGSGFATAANVFKPQRFMFTTLNPKFDERSADNKIRIAGFNLDENIDLYGTQRSPVTSIPLGTPVEDDTRFSIEVSTSKALNDDIILLLGSLDFFDDALGSPELMFSSEYPNVSALRRVYFNRLTDKINYKNLLSFYKWIDDSMGFLISGMIPSNTSFLGMNFVIESHALERNKLRYLQEDIYLGENDRRGLQTDLNLQQVVGRMKRY